VPKPALVGRPYHLPHVLVGDRLHDELLGADTDVAALAKLPIGVWPMRRRHIGGLLVPILAADLARAVRTESAQAVAYWWSVSRETVGRWRRALHVARMTEGTRARWSQLAPQRLSVAARRKGGRSSKSRRAGGTSA
jgi:hypothetical protein